MTRRRARRGRGGGGSIVAAAAAFTVQAALVVLVVLLVVAGAGESAALAEASRASSSSPAGPREVVVEPEVVEVGETLQVGGSGWPARTTVAVEWCGNLALDGSHDCDLQASTVAATDAGGRFATTIVATRPPSPCPCGIRVRTTTGVGEAELARVSVLGAPTREPGRSTGPAPLVEHVAIVAAELDGRGPWTAWFGAAPVRTLRLTLENTGDVVVRAPALEVRHGAGRDPQTAVPLPELPELEPGGRLVVEIPVEFDPLTIGRSAVVAEVLGQPGPAQVRLTTTLAPWGTIGLAAAALLGLAGWLVARALAPARDRTARRARLLVPRRRAAVDHDRDLPDAGRDFRDGRDRRDRRDRRSRRHGDRDDRDPPAARAPHIAALPANEHDDLLPR